MRDDYEEDFELPENLDLEQMFIQQTYRMMNITLGALISYINSSTFDDLSEDRRDYVFDYVLRSWALVLPPPLDDMWEKQIQLLVLTQQIRNLAEQKRAEKFQVIEQDERMKVIYSQLGWNFDTGDKND